MKKIVLLAFVLVLLLTFLVPYAEAIENSWTTKASMPAPRSGLKVAVVNGKIYAIASNVSYEYDPATDTWATKKPMPTARFGFAVAAYQNKIYVIGGYIGHPSIGGTVCSLNEVYDPLTDTWGTKAPMSAARYNLDANVVNGKIYLIGGISNPSPLLVSNVNEVYDPATNSWTTKAPIPFAVFGYASAVVNKKIYVISGLDDRGLSNLNQMFDPDTNIWSFRASIPTAVSYAAAGATTGVMAPKRIYVMGGNPASNPCNLNQVYDPEGNTWTTGDPMPTPRRSLGVAVTNDVLYAIGGSIGLWEPLTAQNEQYTPIGFGTVSQQSEPFPTTWIIGAIAIIAVVGATLLVYFRKIRKTIGKAEK